MEHMTLHCPKCGQTLIVAAQTAGQLGVCPQCGQPLIVLQAVPPLLPAQAPASVSPTAGKPVSSLATASLVLGIVSLFTCILAPVFAIPAIICGHIVRSRALREPAQDQDAKRALTGLSLGYLGLAISVLVGNLLPPLGAIRDKVQPINCSANLKQIGLACRMYASDYRESFPPDLKALWIGEYLDAGKIYTCPATHTAPAQSAEALAAHCDYLYFGKGLVEETVPNPATTVVACDRTGNHKRFWNVAFADGHVMGFSGDDFAAVVRNNHLILPAESAAGSK